MKLTIYVSEEEYDFVKEERPGFVRTLIQSALDDKIEQLREENGRKQD